MERSADWLEAAREDLDHARHAEGGGFLQWACFSAQQAAEKSVKAVFQSMGAEAWGRSVSDLLEGLTERRTVPEELLERAMELDTRPTFPLGILTRISRGRRASGTRDRRPVGSEATRRRSSSSARISYPDRTREEVLASIRQQVEELADRCPVEKAVLFGSCATDDFTVASDVDLLVVNRGKRRTDACSEIKRGVDVRGLEPHAVPEAEYDRRREHFDRMTEGGVVVYGKE